jgi:hypothetical protein
VRNWIQDRKIIAIQPSGQNGVYRIPVASVNAMKRRMGELPAAAIRTEMPRAESPAPRLLYDAEIRPQLEALGQTADQIVLRVATVGRDSSPAERSFVRLYAKFVAKLARTQRIADEEPEASGIDRAHA